MSPVPTASGGMSEVGSGARSLKERLLFRQRSVYIYNHQTTHSAPVPRRRTSCARAGNECASTTRAGNVHLSPPCKFALRRCLHGLRRCSKSRGESRAECNIYPGACFACVSSTAPAASQERPKTVHA
eukprot:3852494-Alexandrium_andersonii.AAC.1